MIDEITKAIEKQIQADIEPSVIIMNVSKGRLLLEELIEYTPYNIPITVQEKAPHMTDIEVVRTISSLSLYGVGIVAVADDVLSVSLKKTGGDDGNP